MTQLNIPYRFISGTKAKANEVNANFDAVANEIDEIYSQILTNTNDISDDIDDLQNSMDEMDTKIDNFLTTYSQNTHFCINSGSINSSTGKENIISNNSTVISFNVSSETPIKATSCSGKEFTIENIEDITLPSLSDGVYTIYLSQDGTVNYYSSVVQCVNVLPSNPFVNEVCLLIAQEPICAYKYSGTQWEEFDSVPLGIFEIDNDEIVSIETLPYNQNGYNLNLKSFPVNIQENGWMKFPNGIIFQWGHYSFNANDVVSFPIAFPNQCFAVFTGDNYNNLGAAAHVNIKVYSKSQFQAACGMYSSGTLSGAAYVFAIGY